MEIYFNSKKVRLLKTNRNYSFRKCFFLFQHFFGGCMRLSSEPDLTFMSGSSYHQNTMALPPVFAANIFDVISPDF